MISEREIAVLFGSQTGNSQDVAERVGRQITRMFCKANVCNLYKYNVTQMVEESLVVFVCSTTGDGEFPDDMKAFWNFLLRKNLPSNSLSHLHFCVLGMGDSSYEKFNVVAKKLNRRLLQLGGVELIPLTLADDQHELGYDAVLDTWLVKLKESLTDFYHLQGEFLSEDIPLPAKYAVQLHEESTVLDNKSFSFVDDSLPLAVLKSNKRVTADDHFQAVHLLEFTINSNICYNPGDVAIVWPENPIDEVEDFLSLLTIPVDTKFTLVPSDPRSRYSGISICPYTARECAVSLFDFLSVPRRSFFEFLRHFSRDETEKEKLEEFTSAVGQEELYNYCNRPKRTILEILKDFPHTTSHVPFEYFFDMIPAIRPRNFSIASSLSAHPNEFHLIVAVVEYKTRLQKPRRGLCSTWISRLQLGTSIPFSIKRGSIRLPKLESPVIMVGPGTGCAPFKSFIEERAAGKNSKNILFFGCRYESKDFLFRADWDHLCSKELLTLITAFSRDQEDKVYVQHKITENGHLLWDLIHNQEACIYVAGNAKQMPQSVKEAFLSVLESNGELEKGDNLIYMADLERKGRYQSETWA